MPKFSIIIPVYNVEKYIARCLDSIFNQTCKDFEVIVVNDGTKDKSMDIVKKYNVTVINQKNQGLSVARNTGVKHAKGDYILFIDSDDYIEKNLFKELDKSTKNKPDLVRFQVQKTWEDSNEIKKYEEIAFEGKNGVEAFNYISKYHFVENAWCYLIKREYYQKNKFSFAAGAVHEDFGLMPLVIIKANKVNSIPYCGYNYFQRQNSIMSEVNYEKTEKKVSDTYIQYKSLLKEFDKTKLDSKVFKSFVANTIIIKICELNNKDYKKYKKLLREEKVYDNLLTDTVARKIKKIFFKISPKLTVKLLKK